MLKVKTLNENFKFKIQGRMVDHVNPVRVKMTHDVQCKLNDGVLTVVLDKKEEPKKEIKIDLKDEIKETKKDKKEKSK